MPNSMNVLNSFISILRQHRIANIILITSFWLAVVLPHKMFGSMINRFFLGDGLGLSRNDYNTFIASIFIAIVLLFITICSIQIKNHNQRIKVLFYLISTIIFAILCVQYLFVINIEMIHFPQYAMVTILLFPILNNYQSALILATLLSFIDEAYQYFYLAPNDTGYFDFNDIITNIIGCAFGLIALKVFDIRGLPKQPKFYFTVDIWATVFLIIGISCLYWLDTWSIYPQDGIPYPLIKKKLNSFWTEIPPGIVYHVVRPFEALIITPLFILFYSKMD